MQIESKMENAINLNLIGGLMDDKMEIPLSLSFFVTFIEKYVLFFALFVLGTILFGSYYG